MAIYSCHIGIVQRSRGGSAVAGAAYDARDTIWDEYRGRVQNFVRAHSHERVVADLGVMTPDAAPDAWRAGPAMPDDAAGRRACHDARLALWNAAEAAERSETAQTARRFMIAFPDELTTDQAIRLGLNIMEYLRGQGMVVDGVLHEDVEPNAYGHRNLHFHGQATMRPCDEDGFAPCKRRNAYRVRDTSGRDAVLLPEELKEQIAAGGTWEKTYRYDLKGDNGKRVATAVLTPSEANMPQWEGYERRNKHPLTEKRESMPWNDRTNAEVWRAGVADLINGALIEAGIDARVDHRSYERQGLDIAPQLHEGGAVTSLERNAKAQAEAEGRTYAPVTEIRRQNIEIAAINDAAALECEIQAYRDALADTYSGDGQAETIEDLVGADVAEAYAAAELRAVISQTEEAIDECYGGRLDGSLVAWSDRMDGIARAKGLEREAPDDETLLLRFEAASRRAITWARHAHERGDQALSRLFGAWGDAWTTVRRKLERTSAITRAALRSPSWSVRDILAVAKKAMDEWISIHRSVGGGSGGGTSSSSSYVPESTPSPSRGIER